MRITSNKLSPIDRYRAYISYRSGMKVGEVALMYESSYSAMYYIIQSEKYKNTKTKRKSKGLRSALLESIL